MRPRSLLLLFLVVAGLGAFVWFFERDLPSTDDRTELAKKVLAFEAEEVSALTIERDGIVVRMEKVSADTTKWRLVEPLTARADEDEVKSVLDQLTGLEKERTLVDFAPEELGLTSPRITVRLAVAETEWVLKVGEEVPATPNVIAAVEGTAEAYVVSGGFREDLEREPGEWRSRDVLPFDGEVVSRVEITGGPEEVVLVRDAEGDRFLLDAPFQDEADRERVSELLDALTGLEIETFVDEPAALADLGLEPAAATLRFSIGSPEDVEIRLGGAAPGDDGSRYVLTDGQVVVTRVEAETDTGADIETGLVELVSGPASAWRSLDWSGLEVFAVDKLEVREGESELVLERSSGDWLRGGDKIAYTTASDVLYAIRDSKAERVVARDEVVVETPLLEIVLFSKDGEEVLRLYPQGGETYPGVREGREAVLMLSRESVDELRAKIGAARDAEPLPAVSAEATEAAEQ